ncbi:ATP-dependent RNA helicase cgh-1 [Babesia sp. Xinjiang]|uniref:ATP-dependent RNA helicase cgh-1 n=1 Tax=Babesia sp. Xinjiang TaxID=462227 RepID=UPI000A25DA60|nr:ATP-dependent RNA helicase cgh-1 [Babesia sp. Xinjiang]ORM39916.1 ATP-dependent RNA helicase cgh-1 [Babesia sp. Xinjiang]
MGSQVSVPTEKVDDFTTLGIHERLRAILEQRGINTPSRHQHAAIKTMINRQDIILQSKSGTGKTLSFCVAVIHMLLGRSPSIDTTDQMSQNTGKEEKQQTGNRIEANLNTGKGVLDGKNLSGCNDQDINPKEDNPNAPNGKIYEQSTVEEDDTEEWETIGNEEKTFGEVIIVAPTRELAGQIYRTLSDLSGDFPEVKVSLHIGGGNISAGITELIDMAPQIIVATPGRLLTNLKRIKIFPKLPSMKKQTVYWNTKMLIFDEADMLIDEHFLDQTKNICMRVVNPFVQVVATSATFIKVQFKLFEEMVAERDVQFTKRLMPYLANDMDDMYGILKCAFGLHVHKSICRLVYSRDIQNEFIKTKKLEGSCVVSKIRGLEENTEYENVECVISTYDRVGYQGQEYPVHSRFRPVVDFLKSYARSMVKIIVSASHVNRVELPTKGVICFTENDCLQDLQSVKSAIKDGRTDLIEQSDTPVLKNVVFCYAEVPEAPNIVKQVSVKLHLIVHLLRRLQYRKCIIFSNQSHTRMLVSNTLQRLGMACNVISSRQSSGSRQRTVASARQMHENIIIAADVISRGIHIDDVDLIINMDLPGTKEGFLHRSGRTGRFGKAGMCVSICTKPEMETLRYLEYALNFKCGHIEDVLDMDKCDECSSVKREYYLDVLKINHITESLQQQTVGTENGVDCHASTSPQTKEQTEDTKNAAKIPIEPKSWAYIEANPPRQGYNQLTRDPIIASIHCSLFPGLMECIIPAFAVMAEDEVYLEGVEPCGISGPGYGSVEAPTSENTFRLRFLEYETARVVIHVPYELYNSIAKCERGEEFTETLHHMVAVQHGGSVISMLDPVHRIFKPIEGTLIISIVGRRDALHLLSGLMTTLNVEFLVHSAEKTDTHVVPLQYIESYLAAYPGKRFYTKAQSLLVELFGGRYDEECREGLYLYLDAIIKLFITGTGTFVPPAFTLAYQMVTDDLYAISRDVLGVEEVVNRRLRTLTLKHPCEVSEYVTFY